MKAEKMRRICSIFVMLLVFTVSFYGCAKTTGDGNPNAFYLYFLNNEGTALEKRAYTLKAKKFDDQLVEIIDALSDEELAGEETVAIPKDVEVTSYLLNDDTLQIHLNAMYAQLPQASQVLLRAAVVKTITQLDKVNAVSFFVGKEPLKDKVGNVIGVQTADSYLDSFGAEEDAVEKSKFILYYPTEKGDSLIKVKKTLYYSNNMTPESVVLANLAKDPGVEGLRPAISDSVRILDESVSEGICYLDLSGNFVSQTTGMTTEVSVYAIVNSLTELDGINKVQIIVNDEAANTPASGTVSGIYEPNDALVKEK